MTNSATLPEGSIPYNWSISPEEHVKETEALIQESEEVLNAIAALPDDQCTFTSVLLPMGQLENRHSGRENRITFLQHVSTDSKVRDASVEAEKKLQDYGIKTSMRVDLYERVVAARRNTSAEEFASMDPEDQRLFDRIERDYRRNGLALSSEKREELKELKKRMADLQVDFSRRMNEDTTSITVTKEELRGMPEDWVNGLEKSDQEEGKLVVTVKYPDLFPVMKLCSFEETRRRLLTANDTKCPDNVKALEEAILIRRKAAKLLGYENHAAFKLETKMAKTPKAVQEFLADLKRRLDPIGKAEFDKLLQLKRKESESLGEAFHGKLESWDYAYYTRLSKERESQVDDEKVKEYFSLNVVTQGMLKIYEQVLGLQFKKSEEASVWHKDVVTYEVHDKKSNELIGHFYLDLHPREGKYGHAACFGLRPGCSLPNRPDDLPSAAMVANFSKPTKDKPSLLKHDEVTTYFHELGHVMHQICSKTKWARFHGTSVERDFVEAPSQMLENWCWDAKVLRDLSSHYARPEEKIPEDWVDRLIKAKNMNTGLFNLRQLFFGLFDMTVHTAETEKVDTTAIWSELREQITLFPTVPGSFPAASFGHIMGGYDAGYYGYLWSEVFSADMFFSRFDKEGVMDPSCGESYRKVILHPGGSRDGMDMLKEFLGREPTLDAFLKSIGLTEA
ncbi:MAG: hypothetical protein DHS80DRAFT_22524 [Piptocephalis tieghemiana]|nr:MAG: hypothetical protein DHS80DRAFT_22524 [Piptocephalis tieghemiana]